MLMGKRYSLLASGGSGSAHAQGACTPASWTARFTSSNGFSDNAEAEAEHEEMVNELQAVVLIGNEWANAETDNEQLATEHDPLPASNLDRAETAAAIQCTAKNEDDKNRNSMSHSMENDVGVQEDGDPAGTTTEKTWSVAEDDLSNLYSNVVRSTSNKVKSLSVDTVNSTTSAVVDETAPSTLELLPLPIFEDVVVQPTWPPPAPPSSSFSCEDGHHHEQDVASDGVDVPNCAKEESPNEVKLHQTFLGAACCDDGDVDSASAIKGQSREKDHAEKEAEGLPTVVPAHADDHDNPGPHQAQPSPPPVGEEQTEQADDAAPRRSSQLSKTLRDNLERLLQRGPLPTTAGSYKRRRRRAKTKRDDNSLTTSSLQQTTPSHERKIHQHRYRHHHHYHHRHHHHQQQQKQHESEAEDAQSLVTDTAAVRSPSATSVSSISTISDGIFCQSRFYARELA